MKNTFLYSTFMSLYCDFDVNKNQAALNIEVKQKTNGVTPLTPAFISS